MTVTPSSTKLAQVLRLHEAYNDQVEKLLRFAETYDESHLNRRPADGGWSAIQVMHHLIMSEEFSLAYLRKKTSGGVEGLPKVGAGAFWRAWLLRVSLWQPAIRFKAPKWIDTEALPAHATLAETRVRWQKVRADWAAFLATCPPEWSDLAIYRHPRAGRLALAQMVGFFRQHLSRHAGQIRRALRGAV